MNTEMKSIVFLVVLSTAMAAHHGERHRYHHDDEHDTHGEAHAEEKCPAIPNSLEPVATGLEVIGLLENCQDLSDKCGKCQHKCRDEDNEGDEWHAEWDDEDDHDRGNDDKKFSHWMEKNCAKTCKMCVDHHPKVAALGDSENVLCWKKHGGYDTKHVYKSVPFTSMNDCRDMCFADDECVGVHTTHFDREPRYCELANGGDFDVSMRNAYFWGATRKCLEENPTPDCTDHWTQHYCIGYDRFCTSDCPTWVRLMRSVCRKACHLCSEDEDGEDSEEDHEEHEEGDGEGDGEDGGETETITWQKIENRKVGNNAKYVLESNLPLEEAKRACVNLGEGCVGLSCKRSKKREKCEVLSNVDKQRSNDKFDIYIKS